MKGLERRSYNFEVRAKETEKGSIIEGLAIVYDKVSDIGYFDEKIEKGALDETDLKDVRFLVNHDEKRIPLARSRRNNKNSTMQLKLVDEGLKVIVNLDTENNSEAKSLYSAVKRGDLSGMSFMFSVSEENEKWENIESEHPMRIIKKVDTLVEVSAVTFPAYPDTTINIRSELDSSKQALDNAIQKNNKIKEQRRKTEVEKLRFNFFEKLGGK